MATAWYANIDLNEALLHRDFMYISTLFVSMALKEILKKGETIHQFSDTCFLPVDKLREMLATKGWHCFLSNRQDNEREYDEATRGQWYYIIEHGYGDITLTEDGQTTLTFVTTQKEHYEELIAFFAKNGTHKPPKGEIFILSRKSDGYATTRLGKLDAPLVRENYTQIVLDNFDHLISEYKEKSPCGRLAILSGPPGSGKSYLIRGLVSASEGVFIVIPSHLIGDLSGPEFMPVLMNSHKEGVPIILILEDADAALVTRGTDNFAKISDLLNMGDGLIGELTDVRLIATTNANNIDIDPALQRPGRLCANFAVDLLEYDHALAIYKRLTEKEDGQEVLEDRPLSLAEIYSLSRKDKSKATFFAQKKVGFSLADRLDA